MSYDRLELLLHQIAEVQQERKALLASIQKNSLRKQVGTQQVSRDQFLDHVLESDEELWGKERNFTSDTSISSEYEDDAPDPLW